MIMTSVSPILTLSILVVAGVAILLQLDAIQTVLNGLLPFNKAHSHETFCYQRVVTQAKTVRDGATCFTVSNGRFTRVFEADGPDLAILPGTVYPGLWDGHGHLMQYGEFLHSADLFGSNSLDEVHRRLRSYVDENPITGAKNEWLRGVGWDQMALGGMPTAVWLSIHPA
jgi:predicted amidohydrolase YtcJ